MYRSFEQHHEDCVRFPFERIPVRVFLDTNVINLLVKYPACVFEHAPLSSDANGTLAEDIEALKHVFHIGARADWDIRASQKTMEELSRTRTASLRADLLDYAFGIVNNTVNDDEDCRFAAEFGRRLVNTHFLGALPDIADRELIGNAIGLRCDAFCTCDRQTILTKRDYLKQIPLRIITPLEWWAHVRPWAALWG